MGVRIYSAGQQRISVSMGSSLERQKRRSQDPAPHIGLEPPFQEPFSFFLFSILFYNIDWSVHRPTRVCSPIHAGQALAQSRGTGVLAVGPSQHVNVGRGCRVSCGYSRGGDLEREASRHVSSLSWLGVLTATVATISEYSVGARTPGVEPRSKVNKALAHTGTQQRQQRQASYDVHSSTVPCLD